MKSLLIDAKRYLYNANSNIEKNIDVLAEDYFGLCAQNILSQTRNLLEAIALIQYNIDKPTASFDNGKEQFLIAANHMNNVKDHNWFTKLYSSINVSSSHLTQCEYDSEVLIGKYLFYLKLVKVKVKKLYDMDILRNIGNLPTKVDEEVIRYYDDVYNEVRKISDVDINDNHIYYIEKKSIRRNGLFEYVLSPANDKKSKFDHITAFSLEDIIDQHAISCSLIPKSINMFGFRINIKIINNWAISIRPCEFNKMAKAVCYPLNVQRDSAGYVPLMNALKENNMSLYDYVMADDFEDNISKLYSGVEPNLFVFLRELKKIIVENRSNRSNTIRYLFFKLKHSIIKEQLTNNEDNKVPNTNLSKSTYPFEINPFSFSLIRHNPSLHDLFECFPLLCSDEQLLKRRITYNTEYMKKLYTPASELEEIYLVDTLVSQYNCTLPPALSSASICYTFDKKYLYIKSYQDDTEYILNLLISKSHERDASYKSRVNSFFETYNPDVDEIKIKVLNNAFISSSVLLINGAAGTGKTTLLKYFSLMYKDTKILFLSVTHSAVDNLIRKIGLSDYRKKGDFLTLEGYKASKKDFSSYKILVVDECSTVENKLFKEVLKKEFTFEKMILVGDEKQIESIKFGNWFGIANYIIKDSSYELTINHRSKEPNLKILWDNVRVLKDRDELIERIMVGGWHNNLNNSLFEKEDEDEIILCLNYDGLYGINNINKYMQEKNPNQAFVWRVWTFKKGDRILFNDSYYFKRYFYNNQKGTIVEIYEDDACLYYQVKVNTEDTNYHDVDSHIRFIKSDDGFDYYLIIVDKQEDDDEEENNNKVLIVPFQLAYAVSIHKAQGLEFNSVKVVLTKETEESITHNIFYTAITRAKKKLKIYCDKTSLNNIVKRFDSHIHFDDGVLFKTYSLEKYKHI